MNRIWVCLIAMLLVLTAVSAFCGNETSGQTVYPVNPGMASAEVQEQLKELTNWFSDLVPKTSSDEKAVSANQE